MHRSFQRLAFVLVASAASGGCLRSPEADIATAQAITEIADELSALRADNAEMQAQLDSLRQAVARQDTLLRRFANLAGMPLQ
jgi:septal ring factor EnvC (AmiA/AmiB activator)